MHGVLIKRDVLILGVGSGFHCINHNSVIMLGGLRSYLWFLLILVPVVAIGLFVPLLILGLRRTRAKRRKHNVMYSHSKFNDNNNNITIKTIQKTE